MGIILIGVPFYLFWKRKNRNISTVSLPL